MHILRLIDRYLAKIESAVLVLTLATMVIMAFIQVILRNFFSTGIIWGDTFLRHLVLWVAFLGASLATREDRHINIDVFSRMLSPSKRRWSRLITNLFSTFISILLTRAAYVFVLDEKEAGSTIFLNFPLWIVISIIVVGFAIISFRFLIKSIDSLNPEREEAQGGF